MSRILNFRATSRRGFLSSLDSSWKSPPNQLFTFSHSRIKCHRINPISLLSITFESTSDTFFYCLLAVPNTFLPPSSSLFHAIANTSPSATSNDTNCSRLLTAQHVSHSIATASLPSTDWPFIQKTLFYFHFTH